MYMSEINNNETQRMYGYFENKNVCMMNPNFKDYYTALSDVHTNIDMKHDQFEAKRTNSKMRNEKYRESMQKAIDMISIPSGKFTTSNGEFSTGTSANVLERALERNEYSNFKINGKDSPSLNPIMILPFDIKDTNYNPQGYHFEFQRFNVKKPGIILEKEIQKIANNYYPENQFPTAFVNDCGPKEVFLNIKKDNNSNITSEAVFSGILDSSSSNEFPEDISDKYKVYIPFMNLYIKGGLQGTIMLYAEPKMDKDKKYIVLKFKYFLNNEDMVYKNNLQWDASIELESIPNLPEISDGIATGLHLEDKVKTCDYLLKRFTKKDDISEKIGNLRNDCLVPLFKKIYKKNFTPKDINMLDNHPEDTFGKSFFMNIKHFGDRFRAIDAVILSNNNKLSFTGTFDGFLMRFISLANLYGCYCNKIHNFIINDVKSLTEEQKSAIDKIKSQEKYEKLKSKLMFIKNVVDKIDFNEDSFTKLDNTELAKEQTKVNKCLETLLNIFKKPLPVYCPRGSTIRRAVSCFIPPSFVYIIDGTNKEIVFDEKDMQSVWALTYILYYLKLIATGFTTGYPSILKTVKDKVNDLNAALNNIGEEDKLNSFINKYNDVFNNEQQLSEEEITSQLNNAFEEFNALNDFINTSNELTISENDKLNSDSIIKVARRIVHYLNLDKQIELYYRIIKRWKTEYFDNGYLKEWNNEISTEDFLNSYNWTASSYTNESKLNMRIEETQSGGNSNPFFRSDMNTKVLQNMSSENATLEYSSQIQTRRQQNLYFKILLGKEQLSSKEISNFYSGLNLEDKYDSEKIDAVTFAYLSSKDIETLKDKIKKSKGENDNIVEKTIQKYEEILSYHEPFKMNLYKCFENVTIDESNVIQVAQEEFKDDNKNETSEEKEEEESKNTEESEKDDESVSSKDESDSSKSKDSDDKCKNPETFLDRINCAVMGGTNNKSISKELSELYSTMTYAEEEYLDNIGNIEEDELFITFLNKKKELYKFYKKLDNAKFYEEYQVPQEESVYMDSFIEDLNKLIDEITIQPLGKDNLHLPKPPSRSNSRPTSPFTFSPQSAIIPGGKIKNKSKRKTKRMKVKNKRKTRSKKKRTTHTI